MPPSPASNGGAATESGSGSGSASSAPRWRRCWRPKSSPPDRPSSSPPDSDPFPAEPWSRHPRPRPRCRCRPEGFPQPRPPSERRVVTAFHLRWGSTASFGVSEVAHPIARRSDGSVHGRMSLRSARRVPPLSPRLFLGLLGTEPSSPGRTLSTATSELEANAKQWTAKHRNA